MIPSAAVKKITPAATPAAIDAEFRFIRMHRLIEDLMDRYLVIGSPETCIRQIKRVQELVGISHFNCSFWFGDMEQARVLRSMELFSREVMPAFV